MDFSYLHDSSEEIYRTLVLNEAGIIMEYASAEDKKEVEEKYGVLYIQTLVKYYSQEF